MPRKNNSRVPDSSKTITPKEYKLDVLGLFQADAADIISARTRSQLVHRGGNIRSAGDEVEMAVRAFLKRRLPSAYTVHHGHFLDAALTLSAQCDVIIADNGRFPVLFRGLEGLEYLPFEGVYGFGEVKSTITNKHLDEFISKARDVRTKLSRKDVIDGYIERMEEVDGALAWTPWPERGHYYRFMLGVSSEQFDVTKALQTLCEADLADAPNIICLLDKGVIMAARAKLPEGEVHATYIHPQKQRAPESPGDVDGWTLSEPNSQYPEGATLFYAYTHLMEHLKNNVLIQGKYLDYMTKVVTLTTTFVHKH
jgi:hypothetical protein